MEDFFIISESNNSLTKTQVKKIVKDEIKKAFEKELKKMITDKDVKDIVKKMMINQYKFFWEKRSFWSNNI
jgi:chemotaxis methyl-accepting protein methylase